MKKRRYEVLGRACWSFALMALYGTAVRADDYYWTNGGGNGIWTDPANWTGGTGSFPQSSDNANFLSYFPTLYLEGNQTVNTLVLVGGGGPQIISGPSPDTLTVNSISGGGSGAYGIQFDSSVTLQILGTDASIDGAFTFFGSVIATGGILVQGQGSAILAGSANNVSSYKIATGNLDVDWQALGNAPVEMGIGGGSSIFGITRPGSLSSGGSGSSSSAITIDAGGTGEIIDPYMGTAGFGQLTLNNNSTLKCYGTAAACTFSSVRLNGSTTINSGIDLVNSLVLNLNNIGENTAGSSVTFTGSGTTTLSGTGSFSGGMNITSGTVTQETSGAWGSGPISVQAGAILLQNSASPGTVPPITVSAYGALGGNTSGFVYSGAGKNVTLADNAILLAGTVGPLPVRGIDVSGANYWLGVTTANGTYTVGDNGSTSIYKGAAFGIFSAPAGPYSSGANFTGTINEAVPGQGIQIYSFGNLNFSSSTTFNTTNTESGVTINMMEGQSQEGLSQTYLYVGGQLGGTATVYTVNLAQNSAIFDSGTIGSGQTWNVNGGLGASAESDAIAPGGRINVDSGASLYFYSNEFLSGTVEIKPGGALHIRGGPFSIGNGNSGNVTFDPGSILQIDGDGNQFDVSNILSPNSDVQLMSSYTSGGPGLLLGAGRRLTTGNSSAVLLSGGAGIGIDPAAASDARIIFSAAQGATLQVQDTVTLGSNQTLQIGDTSPFTYYGVSLPQNGTVSLGGSANVGYVQVVSGTQLYLSSSDQSLTTSSITLERGSSLTLDNTTGGNSTAAQGRISDNASLVLNGAIFNYLGDDSLTDSETLGTLAVNQGASTICVVSNSSPGQATAPTAVTFSGGLDLSNRDHGTINFAGYDSSQSVLGTDSQIFLAGQPDGFIGSWAVVDTYGLDPDQDANFAKYDSTNGVMAMNPLTDYASDFSSSGHVRLTGPVTQTLTAPASICTLTLDNRAGSVSVDQAGFAMTLTKGGILSLGGFNASISGGTLTTGTSNGELDIYTQSVNTLEVDSQIVDNGATPLSLVKSGAGTLVLGGTLPNTFTGITYLNAGQLILNKSGTYATDGPVIVRGGQLTELQPNQFGPDVNLTVSAGSLSLQANTIQSYTINDGSVSSTNAWTVTTATLNGGSTTLANGSVWTIGSAGSPGFIHPLTNTPVLVVTGGTTDIVAGSSTIVQGSTTFTATNNPTIQIDAGSSPGAGLLKLEGDVYVTGTTGVAGIVTGTVGSGQAPGVVDLNGVLRTFSISSGGTLVISAQVTDGGINVSGSGFMELMAANTYSMGTTLSGGALMASNPAALGSGAINFEGGSLELRSDSSAVSFSQPLSTTASGSISLDLGPVTASSTAVCSFTFGAVTLGVAMNLTGAAGESLTLPSVTLQNKSGSPTAIHNSANLIVNGPITMAAGASDGDILKDQGGTLTLEGTNANTYTGTTTVSGGTLVLDKSTNVDAVPHDLDVFGGGTVQLLASGQIDPSSHITLDAVPTAAVLDLHGNNNTFGTGSGVFLSFVAGGMLTTGAGTATLGGDVQFMGTSGTATITGNLGLGIAGRTFTIARGSAAEDMQVSANVTGGPSTGTAITKAGPGILALSGANTYAGNTTVSAGTLIFGVSGAFPNGNALTINAGTARVSNLVNSNKILLQASSLAFGGSTGAWTGQLDLTSNDMVVHNGVIANIANQLKTGFNAGGGYWNGAGGIVSASAASDSTHLTTLGYRTGGSPLDGVNTTSSDVLVMYIYYGDANLDGTVNGADYQQIDMGFGLHLTGWSNGDFNYDGVIDGSDYSLIDNTFNQINATGATPLAIIANSSATVSAVPEPTVLSSLGIGVISLFARRRRRRDSLKL